MRAGRSLPAIVLVLASVASLGAGGAAPSLGGCSAPIEQNDAGSGRDAGATLADAVFLAEQDYFAGILGVPHANGVDAVDLYVVNVLPGTDLLMIEIWAPSGGKAYLVPHPDNVVEVRSPSGISRTEHYVHVDDPEPGTWTVRVLPDDLSLSCASTGGLPLDSASVPAMGTYDLYYGCNPHCGDP